jgi:hypothetical protein
MQQELKGGSMNLTYDFQTLNTTKQTRGQGEGNAQLS